MLVNNFAACNTYVNLKRIDSHESASDMIPSVFSM